MLIRSFKIFKSFLALKNNFIFEDGEENGAPGGGFNQAEDNSQVITFFLKSYWYFHFHFLTLSHDDNFHFHYKYWFCCSCRSLWWTTTLVLAWTPTSAWTSTTPGRRSPRSSTPVSIIKVFRQRQIVQIDVQRKFNSHLIWLISFSQLCTWKWVCASASVEGCARWLFFIEFSNNLKEIKRKQ